MIASTPDTNLSIKKEADQILYGKGLFDILSAYGKPFISGSYALDLMTWRDLDIYLSTENMSGLDFFQLGATINRNFQPVKMSFRNELIARTPGLPSGIYWGVYLGNERSGAWKIDIWAVSGKESERLVNYCTAIRQRLNTENADTIMRIKSDCWRDPAYRKTYTSMDIYDAVLDHDIHTTGAFREYLVKKLQHS